MSEVTRKLLRSTALVIAAVSVAGFVTSCAPPPPPPPPPQPYVAAPPPPPPPPRVVPYRGERG